MADPAVTKHLPPKHLHFTHLFQSSVSRHGALHLAEGLNNVKDPFFQSYTNHFKVFQLYLCVNCHFMLLPRLDHPVSIIVVQRTFSTGKFSNKLCLKCLVAPGHSMYTNECHSVRQRLLWKPSNIG